MSYCRWSTNDYGCDLYCYESVDGGWITHVAGNRIVGVVPHVNWWLLTVARSDAAADEFQRQYEAQQAFLDTCQREPIGLGADGASFTDGSLEQFRARLLLLRDAGYRFPNEVLAEITEEIAERDKDPSGQRAEVED